MRPKPVNVPAETPALALYQPTDAPEASTSVPACSSAHLVMYRAPEGFRKSSKDVASKSPEIYGNE